MAKCTSCSQITAHDDADPEIPGEPDDTESRDAPVCEVRRLRVCADCGEELKEATFEVEGTDPAFAAPADYDAEKQGAYDPDACPARVDAEDPEADPLPCEFEWQAEAENTERVQNTDKHGKPIKSSRYMKRYYGVEVTFEGTCRHCGATASASGADEVQASGMDDLT